MSISDYERAERIQFDPEGYDLGTLAVRAGQHRSLEGEHSDPIYPTSSFVFSSAREAAARFGGEEEGNIYSRFTNPTVQFFEERIAALEGGERAVATSSGMAAILSTCLALMKVGDHVVCSRSVFGSTVSLFEKYLSRTGITTTFVDPTDLQCWEDAITENTKILFLETPSNPLAELTDISAVAKIAHQHDVLLVVDNCFCTPVLQQPLKQGADIIIHSATKYLDGQGRCVGGVVVGAQKEMEEVFGFIRTGGACMSPFNAWVFLKGLETLKIRMDAHCRNALEIANWLEEQTGVERVFYSGLESHPQHELAKKQQSGFGGVLSFEVKGGQEAAWRFIDATTMVSITGNLGDVKTTITHPSTTTHGRMSEEDRVAAGIHQNLIRLSVGIEDIDDIKADMQRGLAAL
ncbi:MULTISPECIES: O-succinylhomoserine sulfhydrylase [unclassified Neptuniibacter]|jgi:O-succinylhomoserine sulfhydrylase|uniref:O-succinylhomoserine sulfhydrylase n=1 Tax=unclassified Neptuniibacter TaxID=2630693 RepID=UPI0026E15C47|nr:MULTISPECIES: O-succinylhomoserine sulfhydrylase [unclassified Neptuniibacter]MDO6513225.1 O-succinylhomoserine sulfhydrylase [Neptuniibacter sp. 2_MG-2023]MDO6592363.1 O-succinylhomoserine sulfhydrylase [Neptuniibacter sp. 1_MG-2023]